MIIGQEKVHEDVFLPKKHNPTVCRRKSCRGQEMAQRVKSISAKP